MATAIVTWDPPIVAPGVGLDASWVLGLNWAAQMGLNHGTEVVWTYGPLGFLQTPLVIDGTLATLGAINLLALRIACAATMLYAARLSLPWIVAAPVAFAAMMIVSHPAVPLALTVVWCVLALQHPEKAWMQRVVVIGGGAMAGLTLLIKLNTGITILTLVGIAALALPGARLRNLGTMLAWLLGVATIAWFLAGQGISNIDDYVKTSIQTVSGYAEVMQYDAPKVSWDKGAAIGIALLAVAAAWVTSRRLPRRQRAGLVLLTAVLMLALWKYGFVRHDAGHLLDFASGAAAFWVALHWRGGWRVVPVAALAAMLVFSWQATLRLDGAPFKPGLAYDQLTALLIPSERAEARDESRTLMAQVYDLDREAIDLMRGAPVEARPWEIGIVWAYDLDWSPVPVLGDYQAYTPELDRLNAEALASADGPKFLIRHIGFFDSPVVGVDGRWIGFDAPQESLAMLCLYRAVFTTRTYQVLERSSNRCGAPRDLGSVTAGFGEEVPVPRGRPDEAVFATVDGAVPHGIEALRTLLFRAAVRRIHMAKVGTARIPPRSLESGIVLRTPAGGDFAPFYLAPQTPSFKITSAGGFMTTEGPLEVHFSAVPMSDLTAP